MSPGERFWVWAAFVVLAFVFVLHGSFTRSESGNIPNIGSLGYNVSLGGISGGMAAHS